MASVANLIYTRSANPTERTHKKYREQYFFSPLRTIVNRFSNILILIAPSSWICRLISTLQHYMCVDLIRRYTTVHYLKMLYYNSIVGCKRSQYAFLLLILQQHLYYMIVVEDILFTTVPITKITHWRYVFEYSLCKISFWILTAWWLIEF